jgi:hypothetical protein
MEVDPHSVLSGLVVGPTKPLLGRRLISEGPKNIQRVHFFFQVACQPQANMMNAILNGLG